MSSHYEKLRKKKEILNELKSLQIKTLNIF